MRAHRGLRWISNDSSGDHMKIKLTVALVCAVAMTAGGTAVAQDKGETETDKLTRKILEDGADAMAKYEREAQARRVALGLRGEWAISPDGAVIAAGSPTGKIEVWSAGTAAPTMILDGHRDHVTSLAFGPSAQTLYSTGAEGVLKTWDLSTRKLVGTLGTPKSDAPRTKGAPVETFIDQGYSGATTSRDGAFLAVTSLSVSVWSLADKRWLPSIHAGVGVTSAGFASTSQYFVASTMDGVSLYDLLAPPKRLKDPADPNGRDTPADPIWTLRAKGTRSWLPGSIGAAKTTPELGDASYTMVLCMADSPTVVTYSAVMGLDPAKQANSILRAWSVQTGKKLWEKSLTPDHDLFTLPCAEKLIPIEALDGKALELYSAADGSKVRTYSITTTKPMPDILTADCSVGYTADKNGQLIRIEVIPAPKPQTPVPTTPAPATPGK